MKGIEEYMNRGVYPETMEKRSLEVRSDALFDLLGRLFLIDPETGEALTMSQDPEDMGNGSYRLHVHNADHSRNWMHTITTEEV